MSFRYETNDPPALRAPIMVAAFEGWNDAGDAATDAVEYLELIWDASPLAELDADDYYDYQVNRPNVQLVNGITREVTWPSTRISACTPPGSEHDLVLLRGIEPNFRWKTFCDELLGLAESLGVTRIILIGALLADTPHTRPVPVTGTAFSAEVAKQYGLEQTKYEGPTGIVGVLQDQCVRRGIPAVSFWAAIPHYVAQPPNPKGTVALLRRIEDVLDVEVPLGEMPVQAEEWEQAISEMAEDDEEIAEYVRALEERGDAEDDLGQLASKIDGDDIAHEFERYLRRRGPGTAGGHGPGSPA